MKKVAGKRQYCRQKPMRGAKIVEKCKVYIAMPINFKRSDGCYLECS